MEIREFAEQLLFGSSLADKLYDAGAPSELTDRTPLRSDFRVPDFPGRPPELLEIGNQSLPRRQELENPQSWAQMLHFFANHELLAIELMAMSLLLFPDTPQAYRRGVVGTIVEEQQHLSMYLERLKQLGIEFGAFALNDFFWRHISCAKSAVDFVVLMNMTFEQANLDYSLYYKSLATQLGDQQSVGIFEKIHQDEIRHVGHGVKWFNRWRSGSQAVSDWEAFVQQLPGTLSPRRARGIGFDVPGREQAGLSRKFIDELYVCGGSVGRPADIYFFNPECDLQYAQTDLKRADLSAALKELIADLECLPVFLSRESDIVLVSKRPSLPWLHQLADCGLTLPEIAEWDSTDFSVLEEKRQSWGALKPWGFTEAVARSAASFLSERKLPEPDSNILSLCNSKQYAGLLYSRWRDKNKAKSRYFEAKFSENVCQNIEQLERYVHSSERYPLICKALHGSAGNASRVLSSQDDWKNHARFFKKLFSAGQQIVVQPFQKRLFDFSWQLELSDTAVKVLGVQQFFVGPGLQYRGAWIGKPFATLSEQHLRFFFEPFADIGSRFSLWKEFISDIAGQLQQEGYRGAASVDAFLYETESRALQLRPLCEINARFSMGRVAYELATYIDSGSEGLWLHLSRREIEKQFADLHSFQCELERQLPIRIDRQAESSKISQGALFTNDPFHAKRILSVLLVGSKSQLLRIAQDLRFSL